MRCCDAASMSTASCLEYYSACRSHCSAPTCRHVEDAGKFLNEQQFKKTRLDKHRPPMIAPPQVHVLCNAHAPCNAHVLCNVHVLCNRPVSPGGR
jgi:hypothetical protein